MTEGYETTDNITIYRKDERSWTEMRHYDPDDELREAGALLLYALLAVAVLLVALGWALGRWW